MDPKSRPYGAGRGEGFMARTITEIQAQIIAEKERVVGLSSLNSESKTAIWRLWTHVVATAIWTLEVLFDFHKKEVDDLILSKKPHSLHWYRAKAKAFQMGGTLARESDCYDNTGLSTDEINKQCIVKQAAVVEINGVVRIKVTKEAGDQLAPLSSSELSSFTTYMQQIKDAGVRIRVDSLPPDDLQMEIDIYYDPLVLNGKGEQLKNSAIKPVEDTIKTYLKNLPFNGEFVLATLTDRLQETTGVIIPQIGRVLARYGNQDYKLVTARYVADAGYLQIAGEKGLIINYIINNTQN